MIFKKGNSRYLWSMSQGGFVGLVDRETGHTTSIKPVHPDGMELRFNWNSAIAQNPFNENGLYFGSQFVHKSNDSGMSWEIISPDLTTNDTAKINAGFKTGGLTPDVTRAENHATILAILPSPVDKNTIWVGTDDGNLQLTRDGGKNWANLSNRLPGAPKNAWIPYIELNQKNAGEAFIILNNYRQNDWGTYLYHTTNFGETFQRLADGSTVKGHTLSIVQDPVEEDLLILGTDYGLYFSIDKGQNWNKWMKDYPSVSTRDLKIHPRDHDLIVGSFGRSIWIFDDIRVFRELAKTKGDLLKKDFDVISATEGYLASFRSVDGVRFTADATFIGDNKGANPMISIWVKKEDKEKTRAEKKKKKDKKDENEPITEDKSKKKVGAKNGKVKIRVINMAGDTIRTYSRKLDPGMNRFGWSMNRDGVRYPSWRTIEEDADPPGNGPDVSPGTYKMVFSYGDFKDSTMVKVNLDPRRKMTPYQMQQQEQAINDFSDLVITAYKGFERLKESKKTIKLVNDQMVNAPDSIKTEIKKLGKSLTDSISQLQYLFTSPRDAKGIQRRDDRINSYLFTAAGYIYDSLGKPSQMAQYSTAKAEEKITDALIKLNAFFEIDWKDYRAKVEAAQTPIFKDYKQIKIN